MVSKEFVAKPLAFPGRSVWGPRSVLKRRLERHSVEEDVKEFCGWDLLQRIIEVARTIGYKGKRNAGFVATIFNTGGRVSEVLALKPTMFSIFKGCKPKLVVVTGMPLLKRYKKVDEFRDENGKRHYITQKREAARNSFSMRVDEPLVQPMLEWIVETYRRGEECLFPSPYTNRPLTRKWAYNLMRKIGKELGIHLYDHWFRAQRASQLALEYDLREVSLLEWFQWECWETAKGYCKLGPVGLAKKMGVRFRKDRGLRRHELSKLITN